jgi:citrate lyase subunit beta/citryl-CoA lyase
LILDLEDAVAPGRKEAARAVTAGALSAARTSKKLFVRVNALDTGLTLDDLGAVMGVGPFGIVLPKCRGGDDARLLGHHLSAIEARRSMAPGLTRILAIATENGASMFGLGTYAGVDRLCGLMWGGEDLAADLGASANRDAQGRYTDAFRLARTLTLCGAAAAGVDAIDAVHVNFRDLAGLRTEAGEAARDGFAAKAAIHPDQVEAINAAFTPSAEALAWATRVVEAFAAAPGAGAIALEGRMIDRPHERLARRLLARAVAGQG